MENNLPGPTIIQKNKKGQIITCAQKKIVVNLYKSLGNEKPLLCDSHIFREISTKTGIGYNSVYKIVNDFVKTGEIVPTIRKRKSWAKQPDSFEENAIRRKIHVFLSRNEPPTVSKILAAVNEDEGLENYGRTKLHEILLRLDFRYQKRNRNSILLEREDLIRWRQSFLLAIYRYRLEGWKIFYLDETWLNEGHTTTKCWSDNTVKSAKQALLEGLSTGLTNPSGKGKRLIITHIGSEDGFLPGGKLVFESGKTNDYHEEMTGKVFTEWFSKILELLPPKSVIVLDNASYHSTKLEKIPTTASTKADIKRWLETKGITYSEDSLKKDLLVLVHRVRSQFDKYVVDTMAESKGFKVLRLPPYHCELNPIELIWADIKSYAARKNTTYKLKDVKVLLEEALAQVTPEKWKNCVQHVVEKVEPRMRALDGIDISSDLSLPVEPIIINFGDDSDDDEEAL